MLRFDSGEYWKIKTWDRFKELKIVNSIVHDEFIRQEKLTKEKVILMAEERKFLNILDLGCGTGKIADSILKVIPNKVHITLIDFNENTLKKAKYYLSNHSNLSFHCMNAYDIGQKFTNHFDVVICLEIIHHITDLGKLFNGINNILNPSGVLIGNVFAEETYRDWDRIKYGTIKSFRRQVLKEICDVLYPTSPNPIKKIIRISGFSRIEPLSKENLALNINPYFELLEINSSYYHWFLAKPKR